jgi:2-polyprenyl-3-methyl-5-hydroxy-6-metoxy-1,4-benzoquinol methylase
MKRFNLIQDHQLDLTALQFLAQKPPLFEPGEEHFWNDPYISQQMLAAHIDPNTDAASRRPETIERTVAWMVRRLGLSAGAAILDMGCGPGLYTSRLSRLGYTVTGVDFSPNSIQYARQQAQMEGLPIRYIDQDYRTTAGLPVPPTFDAVLLIYYDLGVFAPPDRDLVLANAARAIKPGGVMVFDLTTAHQRAGASLAPTWAVKPAGFWRPGPHLTLSQTYHYPAEGVYLDQYIVVEASGETAIYRVWEVNYTPETIRAPLENAGLVIESMYADLAGAPYSADAPGMGIVARKPG